MISKKVLKDFGEQGKNFYYTTEIRKKYLVVSDETGNGDKTIKREDLISLLSDLN